MGITKKESLHRMFNIYLLRQQVVLSLYSTLLQEGTQVFGKTARHQVSVSATGLSTVFDSRGRDTRAETLQARDGHMELLQRVSGSAPVAVNAATAAALACAVPILRTFWSGAPPVHLMR